MGDARQFAGSPAGAVYGTILVSGQLAVESSTGHSTSVIIGSLLATVAVFWLAHAYTDTLGGVISDSPGKPVSLRHALRKEWPIVESALLPAVVLLASAIIGTRSSTAVLAALITANVELVGWAFLAARRAGLTGLRRVSAGVIGALLGLALVALKFLIH